MKHCIALLMFCATYLCAESLSIDSAKSAPHKFYVPAQCLQSSDLCITSSTLEVLESKIDILTQNSCCACAPTPIHAVDLNPTFVITVPGVYCLAEDVAGLIEISSDEIVLDLNGHTLFGSITVFAQSTVQIKNGLITTIPQNGHLKVVFPAIAISGQSDAIEIDGITVRGNPQAGIDVEDSYDVTINNCILSENLNGLSVQDGCQDIDVRNCLFDSNGLVGAGVTDSTAIRIENCVANRNGGDGFSVSTSDCIQVILCIADANKNDGFVFAGAWMRNNLKALPLAMNGSGIVVKDCSACFNNNNGFESIQIADINFANCFAQGNLNGFEFENNSRGIIRACTATNNRASTRKQSKIRAGIGFDEDGTNAVQYYSNYACDNDINYSLSITKSPISSPCDADGIDNIDCNLPGKKESNNCSPSSSSDFEHKPCPVIPIVQDDFVSICRNQLVKGCVPHLTGCLIITQSGTYCLAEDVTGNITIQASNVTLDLNGHTIFALPALNGVTIQNVDTANPLINVTVTNGLLLGVTQPQRNRPATRIIGQNSFGISIDGSVGVVEGIRLENLSISNWSTGISASGLDLSQPMSQLVLKNLMVQSNLNDGIDLNFCTDVFMDNSSSLINSVDGLNLEDCLNFAINRCAFNFNTRNGVAIGSSGEFTPIFFTKCQSNNNTADGFYLDSVSGIQFVQCVAESNAAFGFELYQCSSIIIDGSTAAGNAGGFFVDYDNGSFDIMFKDCVACANNNPGLHTSGFSINSANGICLENCISKGHVGDGFPGNGSGFIHTNSTPVNPSVNITRGCTATDNTYGFYDDGLGDNRYYSNVACGNTNNYIGVTDAPIASAVSAQPFENVDCTLTQPNPANATLSIVEQILSIVVGIDQTVDTTLSITESISAAIAASSCPLVFNTVVQIESIVEDIEIDTDKTLSIVENISSVVDTILVTDTEIASRVEVVESFVENLSSFVEIFVAHEPRPCDPIMINTQTTITAPGTYCLAHDIQSNGVAGIRIASDKVIVDLNGHTITANASASGISVDGFNTITIRNGFIVGTSEIASQGITAFTVNNITIEQVNIAQCAVGVNLFSINDFMLNSLIIINNSANTPSVLLVEVSDGIIKNTQIDHNNVAIAIGDSSKVRIEASTITRPQLAGINIDSCTCIECVESMVCASGGDGFIVTNSSDIFFNNCYASDNNTGDSSLFAGFNIDSTNTDAYLLNCVADSNGATNGFGFLIETTSGTLVQGCSASGNGTGFHDSGNNANRFYSNIACYNATNFSPTGTNLTAHVVASSAAGAFQNVACN